MKLEQQVCSLELAKKLKELGVKQESAFVWSVPNPEKGRNEREKLVLGKYCEVMLCHKARDWGEAFDVYSAFTVAELGEMLPAETSSGQGNMGGWRTSSEVSVRLEQWRLRSPGDRQPL